MSFEEAREQRQYIINVQISRVAKKCLAKSNFRVEPTSCSVRTVRKQGKD